MAMGDRGLACPVSFPTVSRSRRISPPAPSTSGPLTQEAYISAGLPCTVNERLFPIIHRDRGAKDTGTTGDAGRFVWLKEPMDWRIGDWVNL
jgi:hypothetical protein